MDRLTLSWCTSSDVGTLTAKEERKRLKEEKRDRRKGKKRRLEVEAEHLHGQPVEQVLYMITLISSVSCRLIRQILFYLMRELSRYCGLQLFVLL